MVFTGSDASLPGERKLLEVRAAPKGYRCLFDGITDRDGAAKLNNQRIYVTKDLLAPPDEMRFYHFELEGMVVVSRDGATTLGRVKAVHNYPTLDALEIESGHTEPVLIPMTNDTILSIDRKTATITLAEKNIDDLFD
jgi:16S rRNA processing protein RimM